MQKARRDPLTRGLTRLVSAYRNLCSSNRFPSCRFVPSCSEYTLRALERYGSLRGLLLSANRLLRCHPFSRPGVDPLP